MKKIILVLYFLFSSYILAQNVIVVVIDGARYSETFGGGNTYIPHMFDDMSPNGQLYTNFRIDDIGKTETNPGHSTILSGTWQQIANDGTQRPTNPTVFEYIRKEDGNPQSDCYAVTGKAKLDILTYSTHSSYGSDYGGTWFGADERNDALTYSKAISVMQDIQPKILLIHFAAVDAAGHSGNWSNYLAALTNADDLVYQLWQHIQSGDYGYTVNNTTMFVTNDHGRHDDLNGGFQEHGDDCDGCEHIMLLALGRNVTPNVINNDLHYQIDIASTVGDLLGFSTPQATGTSLFEGSNPLPTELTSFSLTTLGSSIKLNWNTATEINNFGFEILRQAQDDKNWEKIGFVNGNGNSNSPKEYSFVDDKLSTGKYSYRLKQIDNDGQFEYSKIIEVDMNGVKKFELSQNYPNPFNPSTVIGYELPVNGFVSLKVFDVLGNEIATLVNEEKPAGSYNVQFTINSVQLGSGVYFYRLQSGDYVESRKMVILK